MTLKEKRRRAVIASCKWTKKFPEKMYRKNWKKRLKKNGWTPKSFEHQNKKQKGRCYLCKRLPKKNRKLCTDHNHKTGKARKLLRPGCNLKLGWVEKLGLRKLRLYLK